jgi:regulator of cell morphogenesis and NO signaling
MPVLERSATVAQIVLDHPECARIFREHRIDFCCRGQMTVAEACAGSGQDAAALIDELERAIGERSRKDVDPRGLATPELVQLIVARHHEYLRKALPFVEQLARKVARVHGRHDARLAPLADVVTELGETLLEHIDDEEASLFPALLAGAPDRTWVEGELRAMNDEHLRVGDLLSRIRTLAGDFALAPEWACASYRTLMRELEEIESDTFTHVHHENHVLVPRFASAQAPA